MELSVFENGIQSHNDKIHQALQKEGLYVMHEKGYSYTVGMQNIGFPDLILYGQSQDVTEEMFQVLFQAVQLGLVDLEQPSLIDNMFEPKPKLSAVDDIEKRQHFYAARTYYGNWEFAALKITMDFH